MLLETHLAGEGSIMSTLNRCSYEEIKSNLRINSQQKRMLRYSSEAPF